MKVVLRACVHLHGRSPRTRRSKARCLGTHGSLSLVPNGFLWDRKLETQVEDRARLVSHVEQDDGTDDGGSASDGAQTRLGIRAARHGPAYDTADEGGLTQVRGVPLDIR